MRPEGSAPLPAGTLIGRYRIVAPIGSGLSSIREREDFRSLMDELRVQ